MLRRFFHRLSNAPANLPLPLINPNAEETNETTLLLNSSQTTIDNSNNEPTSLTGSSEIIINILDVDPTPAAPKDFFTKAEEAILDQLKATQLLQHKLHQLAEQEVAKNSGTYLSIAVAATALSTGLIGSGASVYGLITRNLFAPLYAIKYPAFLKIHNLYEQFVNTDAYCQGPNYGYRGYCQWAYQHFPNIPTYPYESKYEPGESDATYHCDAQGFKLSAFEEGCGEQFYNTCTSLMYQICNITQSTNWDHMNEELRTYTLSSNVVLGVSLLLAGGSLLFATAAFARLTNPTDLEEIHISPADLDELQQLMTRSHFMQNFIDNLNNIRLRDFSVAVDQHLQLIREDKIYLQAKSKTSLSIRHKQMQPHRLSFLAALNPKYQEQTHPNIDAQNTALSYQKLFKIESELIEDLTQKSVFSSFFSNSNEKKYIEKIKNISNKDILEKILNFIDVEGNPTVPTLIEETEIPPITLRRS